MVTIVDDDGIVSAVIEYLINDIEEIFILDIFINLENVVKKLFKRNESH